MADTEVRAWARWQDWAALVAGVVAVLSVFVVSASTAAVWSLVVLGVLIVASSLWSLTQPGVVATEWVHAALGLLLFLAPFVLMYMGTSMGAAWVSWIAGAVTVVVGLWAVPISSRAHQAQPH